jgi:hypothetical protein
MDPITALALACNVTQLIEHGIDAAKACKEIYEKGSLDNNNLIEQYTDAISASNVDLDTALRALPRPTGRHHTKLLDLAKDCAATSTELRRILAQLKLSKSQGNKRIGGAFKVTLKSIWKRGAIEKLQQTLETQDRALQSGLLKEL